VLVFDTVLAFLIRLRAGRCAAMKKRCKEGGYQSLIVAAASAFACAGTILTVCPSMKTLSWSANVTPHICELVARIRRSARDAGHTEIRAGGSRFLGRSPQQGWLTVDPNPNRFRVALLHMRVRWARRPCGFYFALQLSDNTLPSVREHGWASGTRPQTFV
jgi:hypothetical protein